MSDQELNLLAEKVSDMVLEKLSRKKYSKVKSEKRNRIRQDIIGLRKIKKIDL